MEKMQYAETLVKEFLLYRGFSNTLQCFEAELSVDASNGFQVDRVIELLFSVYVAKFEADNLRRFMISLKQSLVSRSETHYNLALRKLESSLNRYYIVNAVQKGRIDRVLEFFEKYGDLLLQSGDDWSGWFAIPYMKHPSSDPRFHVYFSNQWLETLKVSFGNFLSQAYDANPNERQKFSAMKQELDQMQERCLQLEEELTANEASSSRRPSSVSVHERTDFQQLPDTLVNETNISRQRGTIGSRPNVEVSLTRSSSLKSHQSCYSRSYVVTKQFISADEPSNRTKGLDVVPWQDNELFQKEPRGDFTQKLAAGLAADFSTSKFKEDKKFSEVAIESQETFSGHTSLITRCRFSSKGENIASASVDGTVRIWASDKHASSLNNATIYCGSEILSLEWEYTDLLLLLGTSGGAIRVWNVDGKRVACNLLSNAAFPRVLDLKCSPTDSVFLSATASQGHQGEGIEALGFGSLTVWNMKHWKPVNLLPLGQDPRAVTSVCFNHNGKIVAAGGTDGMIRLFDMNGCQPITVWPVLDSCPVSCVRFGHDQASIWSLGSDGKLFEWSLHNQGQILQSIDASSFSSTDASQLPRHEFAVDSQGKRVLLTSNLNYSPIYSLGVSTKIEKTREQGGAISSVDWHPSESVYATGSADHSVKVTTVR